MTRLSIRLFQRRTIWCPTLWGWICLLAIFASTSTFVLFQSESFLSHTDRQPAEVLVIEAWIGIEGFLAAKTEFERGGYLYVMTVGATRNDFWNQRIWNVAEVAASNLRQEGVPDHKVIACPSAHTKGDRTFESAIAVSRTLQALNIQPKAINVFTLGVHARRSRLVFAKVLQTRTRVGVVSWASSVNDSKPSWRSSERSDFVLKEFVGYLFEALLNSGRLSNSPGNPSHPLPPLSEVAGHAANPVAALPRRCHVDQRPGQAAATRAVYHKAVRGAHTHLQRASLGIRTNANEPAAADAHGTTSPWHF